MNILKKAISGLVSAADTVALGPLRFIEDVTHKVAWLADEILRMGFKDIPKFLFKGVLDRQNFTREKFLGAILGKEVEKKNRHVRKISKSHKLGTPIGEKEIESEKNKLTVSRPEGEDPVTIGICNSTGKNISFAPAGDDGSRGERYTTRKIVEAIDENNSRDLATLTIDTATGRPTIRLQNDCAYKITPTTDSVLITPKRVLQQDLENGEYDETLQVARRRLQLAQQERLDPVELMEVPVSSEVLAGSIALATACDEAITPIATDLNEVKRRLDGSGAAVTALWLNDEVPDILQQQINLLTRHQGFLRGSWETCKEERLRNAFSDFSTNITTLEQMKISFSEAAFPFPAGSQLQRELSSSLSSISSSISSQQRNIANAPHILQGKNGLIEKTKAEEIERREQIEHLDGQVTAAQSCVENMALSENYNATVDGAEAWNIDRHRDSYGSEAFLRRTWSRENVKTSINRFRPEGKLYSVSENLCEMARELSVFKASQNNIDASFFAGNKYAQKQFNSRYKGEVTVLVPQLRGTTLHECMRNVHAQLRNLGYSEYGFWITVSPSGQVYPVIIIGGKGAGAVHPMESSDIDSACKEIQQAEKQIWKTRFLGVMPVVYSEIPEAIRNRKTEAEQKAFREKLVELHKMIRELKTNLDNSGSALSDPLQLYHLVLSLNYALMHGYEVDKVTPGEAVFSDFPPEEKRRQLLQVELTSPRGVQCSFMIVEDCPWFTMESQGEADAESIGSMPSKAGGGGGRQDSGTPLRGRSLDTLFGDLEDSKGSATGIELRTPLFGGNKNRRSGRGDVPGGF